MPLLELSLITGTLAQLGLDKGFRELGRQEAVIRARKKLKMPGEPERDNFASLYRHTLVEWGVFKPEPVLDFFRNDGIYTAFEAAYQTGDATILDEAAEGYVALADEQGLFRQLEYDPRRELTAFTLIFDRLVHFTRPAADAKRDQAIADLHADVQRIYEVVAALQSGDRLPSTVEFSGTFENVIINLLSQLTNTTQGIGPQSQPSLPEPQPLPALDPDGRPPLFAPGALPGHHRLPLPANTLFTGREEELRELARVLLPYDDADLTGLERPVRSGSDGSGGGSGVIISTGIGGVGKTQLAVEFAHRYGRFFHSVWWVSLADPANVDGEVAECGLRMGLHPAYSSLPRPDQVAAVRREWAGPEPRLLIFDNCEDPTLLRDWAPLGGGARLLATSRRELWPEEMPLRAVHLMPLPVPESVTLLRRYLAEGDGRPPRTDVGDADLTAIARELGELPLALRLAGRYLRRHRREPAAVYLAALRRPDLLDHPSLRAEGYSATDHDLDVWRSFKISLDRLRPDDDPGDRAAVALLARAACFAPGEPLPEGLLLDSLVSAGDDDHPAVTMQQTELGLERLLETGLLERVDGDGVRLHRLLARFAAVALVGEMDAAQEAAKSAAISLAYKQNKAGYPQALAEWETHLRHLTDTALVREDDQAATLANNLGYSLKMRGDYAAARPLYERALAIRERALGPDHPDTTLSLNNLAALLESQGDYAAARPLHERALAIRERALGLDHPDIATSLNNLAGLLRAQGDYAAARPLFERALAIWERALGPDHPDTALSLNNLAGLLRAQGDYAAARPLYERALAIRERALGPDHPDTAQSLNNLALLLRAQGDYAAARPLFERALAILEARLGPDHPNTKIVRGNLAALG
jgi:tetratricopeptide (TPR) repeat protein